jgi:hypothetical protein
MNKKIYRKLISLGLIIALGGFIVGPIQEAKAGDLTAMSDTMSQLEKSTAANHTISFTLTAGTTVIQDETITIVFPTGFNLSTIDCGDVDIKDGAAEEELTTVAGGCAAAVAAWGAAVSAQTLTLTAPSGAATYIDGSSVVEIQIGTNATYNDTGAHQITNHATAGSYKVSIGGTFGDSGSLAVGIANDDQVSITATVDPYLTFDVTDPAVALTTLSTSAAKTDTAVMTAATNTASGYSITVSGATLTSGGNTITAMASATTSSINNEQFGLNLKLNTDPAGGANPSGGAAAATGAATGYDTADNFKFVTGDTVASYAGTSTTTTYTMSYIANIRTDTEAGSYTATHTYICTGTF